MTAEIRPATPDDADAGAGARVERWAVTIPRLANGGTLLLAEQNE